MIIDKATLKYFKRDMRKLSSRLFHNQFLKLSRCRIKSEDNRGKMRYHYICGECEKRYIPDDKMIEVDHNEAIGELKYKRIKYEGKDLIDVDINWLNRLFCNWDNLQPLCKPCHAKKTIIDNEAILYRSELL